MAKSVPFVKFSNGQKYPQLGLGTWLSKEGDVIQAVKDAIDIGYRHIDTAFAYGNEEEIGIAVKAKIEDGTVTRDQLYVTSKLWNTFHSTAKVFEAIDVSLKKLQLDYLDMYMIHWPMSYVEGREIFPKDENGKFIFADVDYLESWKVMEKLVQQGKVHSLGLSNFNSEQIQRIIDNSTIKPVNVQVECNPYLDQSQLMNFCKERGIILTAYSPLANPTVPWKTSDDPKLLSDEKIKIIAAKHGKTVPQVCIRWQLQRGNMVIPKSVKRQRLEENFNVFDFELTEEDMKTIDAQNMNYRALHLNWVSEHKYWPFRIPF
ncbi:PREDICTED: aldose reductase-like [Priapulus caudatus]|uniref:Aldose reductase-like n=1 Tax=Priapulus caudatus TaxID=37621 RepID=A0ABM1DZC7_PRICU|nr:PREDICTED: aldose reductase-like [Priapulus caudatus]XP_014665304.1 PREDICTED: aldose reductase-like [Priapulus caudatus]